MIEVKNVSKSYGKNLALDDVSFSINNGEIVGLLGPNGAGKSTVMNIMTGCLSCDGGQVLINDIDILNEPMKAKTQIGYLPEQPPLYTDMKVGEYLDFVYDLKKCQLDREKHLDEILNLTKTLEVRKRLIKNLSKGYKQRVGIAGALVGNPNILIFDEPTAGLDPKQIIEIRNLTRKLGRTHTIMVSSHILAEMQSVCDRVVIINEGKILADEKVNEISQAVQQNKRLRIKVCGTQREVLAYLKEFPGISHAEVSGDRDLDSFAYYIEEEPGKDVRKDLFSGLAEKGWPLIGMETSGMSLEDVFVALTDRPQDKKVKTERR